MYQRILKTTLQEKFFQGKILIITGPRQTGKTTLVLDILKEFSPEQVRMFNCDNPTDRALLANRDREFLQQVVGGAVFIFIDEAQKVENIGNTLKLLADFYGKEKQIIVTGSSSLNLLDSAQEPLTGRKHVYTLFPLSLEEIYPTHDQLKLRKELEGFLLFGAYPEVVSRNSFEEKQELLEELASSSIYKDILELQGVKSSDVLVRLVKALALQIGSEVSYNELSGLVGIEKKTIERYVDLLEKSFVIFRVSPYTKNKRREISKLKKIYFYDLGIRNAVLHNFNFLENRDDVGALWENFLFVERRKYLAYRKIYTNQYFWRTYDGSEVDLVEEREGKLYGYEFKWGKSQGKIKAPRSWLTYPKSSYTIITQDNLMGFVL